MFGNVNIISLASSNTTVITMVVCFTHHTITLIFSKHMIYCWGLHCVVKERHHRYNDRHTCTRVTSTGEVWHHFEADDIQHVLNLMTSWRDVSLATASTCLICGLGHRPIKRVIGQSRCCELMYRKWTAGIKCCMGPRGVTKDTDSAVAGGPMIPTVGDINAYSFSMWHRLMDLMVQPCLDLYTDDSALVYYSAKNIKGSPWQLQNIGCSTRAPDI